jgi:hypothetical protein
MTRAARLEKARQRRLDNPYQQFGQPDSRFTANGATGCTHTVLQFLAALWLEKWVTHDELSKIVGYPDQSKVAPEFRRGLRPSEVSRFCSEIGLPYRVRVRVTPEHLLEYSSRGPIGFGHSYSRWPEWKGFKYRGRAADGFPNGFSMPEGKAGRTQLKGFAPPRDAHFGLLLGIDKATQTVYAWEPNHGSTARRERPAYDLMTPIQFRGVINSYFTILGRSTYALMPTRSLPL